MKVLITGGAGFIGSHAAGKFLDLGADVYILDNLSTGSRQNLDKRAHFLNLDLTDESFVDHLPKDHIDTVVHLAAQSSGEISFERPSYDLKTNTLGTLLLLKWSLEHHVGKFIYASSMSVYGDGRDFPVTERDPVHPKSFYGVGKCASENYIKIFADMGLPATCLRFFNVYGPGQNMSNLKQGMVSIYLSYIAQDQPILVKGSLDRYRDFVYIDDVINAIMLSHSDNKAEGKIFNVCTGRNVRIRDLLQVIIKAFGKDPSYPVIQGEPTPRDQHGVFGNYDLIHRTLGWSPKISLEDGIARMADWVKKYYVKNG